MLDSQRVIINTFAQYTRTAINMVLSLYTIRIVLKILGQSDYGIYSLIAGVVAMLSFFTNALVMTTQRYVSYYCGKKDKSKLNEVFSNCVYLHILLGILCFVLLEIFAYFFFDVFFVVPEDRVSVAKYIYHWVCAMLVVSFATSPYRALFIAHENIVFLSVVEIFDCVIRFVAALLLIFIPYDCLVSYVISLFCINLFNFIVIITYGMKKYAEGRSFAKFSLLAIKEVFSFASWNVYSTACIVGRQQGVAVVVNRFLGTVANAAYGIAFQVAGYTYYISSAIVNAIKPQIVKAEGSGNRARAWKLSYFACKITFFLMCAICIPLSFEMDGILTFWLGDYPQYANIFCIMTLLTIVVDSITGGLGHINQAIGKIGGYSFFMNTPKLLAVPLIYILLQLDNGVFLSVVTYVLIEFFCMWIRIPFLKKTAAMNVGCFFRTVVLHELIPVLACVVVCYGITHYIVLEYRFLITVPISWILFFIAVCFFGLTKEERNSIAKAIGPIFKRISKK